jgi:hypothetical protein
MPRAVDRPLLRFDLLHDLGQVVRGQGLHRREFYERLQVTQGDSLTDGQQIPVVNVSRARRGERALDGRRRFLPWSDCLLKRISLDVIHQREVVVDEWVQPSVRTGTRHRVVQIPVLVAHGEQCRARIVDESLAADLGGKTSRLAVYFTRLHAWSFNANALA